MNKRPSHLTILNLDNGSLDLLGSDHQRGAWHHDSELNDEFFAAFDAAVNPDAISACGLRLSDCCVEKFRRTYSVHDSRLVNSHFSPLDLEELHSVEKRTDSKEIRRGIALVKFYANAARSRGIPLAALVLASGASRYLNPRKNPLAAKYNKIKAAIAAPIIHHMRTAFAFVAQSIRSLKSHLRSVVAATVAANSSTRPMLAGADRERV